MPKQPRKSKNPDRSNPRAWTSPRQKEWLDKWVPEFLNIQKKGRTDRILKIINEAWFKEFPEPEYGLEKSSDGALSPEEIKEREAALSRAIEKRKAQLKSWFFWHTRSQPSRSRKTTTNLETFIFSSDNVKKPKKRAPQRVEVYQSLYSEEIKREVQKEFMGVDKSSSSNRMSIQRQVTLRMCENMDEEASRCVDEELSKLKAAHAHQLDDSDPNSDDDEISQRAPHEYQTAIDDLPYVLNKIVKRCSVATGWTFHIMAAGPNPIDNGSIYMQSYYFGAKSVAGNDFSQAYTDYKQGVEKPFSAHVRNCFSAETCRRRALRTSQKKSLSTTVAENCGDVSMSNAEEDSLNEPKQPEPSPNADTSIHEFTPVDPRTSITHLNVNMTFEDYTGPSSLDLDSRGDLIRSPSGSQNKSAYQYVPSMEEIDDFLAANNLLAEPTDQLDTFKSTSIAPDLQGEINEFMLDFGALPDSDTQAGARSSFELASVPAATSIQVNASTQSISTMLALAPISRTGPYDLNPLSPSLALQVDSNTEPPTHLLQGGTASPTSQPIFDTLASAPVHGISTSGCTTSPGSQLTPEMPASALLHGISASVATDANYVVAGACISKDLASSPDDTIQPRPQPLVNHNASAQLESQTGDIQTTSHVLEENTPPVGLTPAQKRAQTIAAKRLAGEKRKHAEADNNDGAQTLNRPPREIRAPIRPDVNAIPFKRGKKSRGNKKRG